VSDPTPADVVAAARLAVCDRHPYLAHAIFALRPHPAPGLGTLAVDEHWRLYYDPDVVLRWQQEMEEGRLKRIGGQPKGHDGVPAVVFHELGHVLREHFRRRGERVAHAWNCAADREINDDVEEAGWKLPGLPLLPVNIGQENGLTAEEYYQPEDANCILGRENALTPGSGGACGGCAGNPTDWEREQAEREGAGAGHSGRLAPGEGGNTLPPPEPVSALDQEIVLRRTALAIDQHVKARGRGTVPLGLRAWAEARLEPAKVDWRRRLPALVKGALSSVAGACDFTWRKPGRRALHSAGRAGWPLAPSLHRPVPRVGVVLDCSGSMGCEGTDGRTVQEEALSEVVGLAKACGAGVTVYACDAGVHAAARVVSAGDLEKVNRGGGGTDMRPGFVAARKGGADLVVIVTDSIVGDGWPSPADCRGVRLLAVLVGQNPPVPPGHIPYLEAR
jgi:predicted metal-dependent peptidase